uniref:Uncharacterized protein n=1 Tax=Panagrolaimus davidi TaxID=227884 RepID=A0A914P6M9_9BILA
MLQHYFFSLYSVYVLTTVCANRDEYEEINTRAYCDFYSADSYTQHGFIKYYENATPLIYDRQMDLNYRKWTTGIPCIAKNHIYHDLSFPHEKIFNVFEFYEAVGG